MRKVLFVVAVLAVTHLVFAGGIVTNTNQSAQFVRMLSRNASTQIDAVYFNPAGLTQLQDGWHLALHNQTIMQEKTVDNSLLGEYVGEVSAPIFPDVYAAFKKDNIGLFLLVLVRMAVVVQPILPMVCLHSNCR